MSKSCRRILSRTACLAALAAGAAGLACCHVNNLPENLPTIRTVLVVPLVNAGPSVVLEEHRDQGGVAGLISSVAAVAQAVNAESIRQRLAVAVPPARMAVMLQVSLVRHVQATLGLQPVTDASQPHDAELQIAVSDYGLRRDNSTDPVSFFFDGEAALVRPGADEIVWRDCQRITSPLWREDGWRIASFFDNIEGAQVLESLGALTDAQWQQVFDGIADVAGRILASWMQADAAGAR